MEQILAAGGRPFRDVDAANIKCKSLSRELGNSVHCQVVPHPSGGFAIVCGDADLAPQSSDALAIASAVNPPARTPSNVTRLPQPKSLAMTSQPTVEWDVQPTPTREPAEPAQKKPAWRNKAREVNAPPIASSRSDANEAVQAASLSLSPSMRAFPFRWVMIVFGIAMMVRPVWLLNLVGITPPEDTMNAVVVFTTISVLSLVLVVVSLCFISWMYMSNSYVFDATGIQQVQWYREKGSLWPRRRRPRVQYHQIRTITIDQSFLQTIMDVGHLRIASGGTDGYEVELRFVASPKRLEKEIQARRVLQPN